MDIPIELFLGGIAVSVALAFFGFVRQPQIPAMLCFGGIFILFISVTTDTLILNTFSEGVESDIITHYNVPVTSGGVGMNTISASKSEHITSSSSLLYNKEINCVTYQLSRTAGQPPLSTPIVYGVWDTTFIEKHRFGTVNASLLSNLVAIPFKRCSDLSYVTQVNDRVGVSYVAGNATNMVFVQRNVADPFDSTVTRMQTFTTTTGLWTNSANDDLTGSMTLESDPVLTTGSSTFEFTELPKVFFALLGTIFMLCGGLMAFRNN